MTRAAWNTQAGATPITAGAGVQLADVALADAGVVIERTKGRGDALAPGRHMLDAIAALGRTRAALAQIARSLGASRRLSAKSIAILKGRGDRVYRHAESLARQVAVPSLPAKSGAQAIAELAPDVKGLALLAAGLYLLSKLDT